MSSVLISSLIEKLGWTLFHSLWQFAGVAIVLWLMLRAMRDSSPNARYRVRFCGLVSMVLLAVAMFCTSETLSTDTVHDMNSTLAAKVPSQSTVAADVAEETIAPQVNGTEALTPETADERVASALVEESLSATAAASSQQSLTDQFHRWREATLKAVAPWLTTMMSAWLLGIALLSVRPLVGWRSVRRLRRLGIVDAPQSAIDAMRDVSQKLGISRVITIVESTLVEVPTVIGWLRPLILLPASAVTGLSREQLEAVIAHELAHVRRYDYLVNAIQVLLETIFFYHPAVWWVSRSMRIERERCCDEIAVGLTGKRTEYAKLLLRLEETRGTAVVVNPALSATGGMLIERIKSLTNTRTGQSSGGGFLPAAILLSVFVGCGLLIAMSGSLSQFALAEDHNEFAWDDLNGASCSMNDDQVMMALHTDKQFIAVVIAQPPAQRESETMNSSGDLSHHSFHWNWGVKRLDVRLNREDQDQLQINSQKVSLRAGRVIYWDADSGAIDQRATLRDAPLTIKTSFPTKQQSEQFEAWLERIREEFSIVSSVERISQETHPEPIDIGGTPTSEAGIALFQRQRPELQINVDSITREFLKAIAGDSTFGGDSTTHVGQRQSIANWQAALEHGGLTREQKVFAWWRIGSLAAYNFDVNSGETHDYDLAAKAFEQVHAIGGDLISRETLNAATVYSSLGRDAEERAARREIAHRWLNTRTDAMIADSVRYINHNGYCIDDDLMPGGMNLDTDAKKHAFLMEMLTSCQRSPAPFESANDSPSLVLPDGSDTATTPINAAAQQLTRVAGWPTWTLASVDEQPTVNVDGLRGHRIVLRRTWKEFTDPPQQQAEAAPDTDRRPVILKSEDWQFVLFPSQPKKAPAELKSKIPWAKNDSPYHTRDVYLGEGLGFVWYTRGTLFGQETVRSKLKLQGGDDRIGLLLDGLRFEDSANSCQYALAQLGDEAIPAIENAMEQSNDSTLMVRLARTLGLMQTDKSTDLLLRLYGSKSDELRNSIAYALIHRPFREKAKDAYLDMLQRHLRVYETCEACVQFDWQEALPVLSDLIDHPANLRELSHTIPARRMLQRNPIGQELLDAKQAIIKAGYNSGLDIAQPRKVLLDSDDTEATLLIAIELAIFTSKGVSRRPSEVGIELLKSGPRQATVDYLKSLVDALPPENRQQAETLLQSVTSANATKIDVELVPRNDDLFDNDVGRE